MTGTNPPTHSDGTSSRPADKGSLLERFRRAVEARVGRRVGGLRIEAEGTIGVVLYGHTDRFYAKQVAQHVATSLTGLPVLANHICVLAPGSGGNGLHGSPVAPEPNGEPR